MNSSPEPTTRTDDGRTHQFDGLSGSGTNPVGPPHPTFGFLTLPGTVVKPDTTMEYRQAPIYLGSDQVPAKYCQPLSRTPSKEDVTMSGRDLEEYMQGIEKDNEESRAAGITPVGDASVLGDVERREGAFDMPSGSGAWGRGVSHTGLTQRSRVSKAPQSYSGRNEQPGMTRRRLSERGGRGLRSQSTVSRSQNDGPGPAGGGKVEKLQGGVDRMSMNDSKE